MLRRSQNTAFAILIAMLTVLHVGCTSSRLLKPKGFGWLSSRSAEATLADEEDFGFPKPSSIEVPRSLNAHRSGNATTDGTPPSGSPSGSAVVSTPPPGPATQIPHAITGPIAGSATNSMAHPMVQNGMYDAPATVAPAANSMLATQPEPFAGEASSMTNAQGPRGTPYASPVPTQNRLASNFVSPAMNDANSQRSIYESESPQLSYVAAPANYEVTAPIPGATGYPAAKENGSIAPTSYLPPATENVADASAAVQESTGTFYQARAAEPRAWRPGSTSDLKTL